MTFHSDNIARTTGHGLLPLICAFPKRSTSSARSASSQRNATLLWLASHSLTEVKEYCGGGYWPQYAMEVSFNNFFQASRDMPSFISLNMTLLA